MFKFVFFTILLTLVSAQEGSGQGQQATPDQITENTEVDITGRRFGNRPRVQYSENEYFSDSMDSLGGLEDADLGNFFARSSPFTTCRVGSYTTRGSPPSSINCQADEVCQTTFVYRKFKGGSFKRFYRSACKERSVCEDNMHSNNLCHLWSQFGRQSIAHCVSCCEGNNCDTFIPYEGSSLGFTDFTNAVVIHHT